MKNKTETTEAQAPQGNFSLTYRREHPGNRCSYGIPGNAGIVVFDRGLFADPAFNGPIMLDVEMAQPKADNKAEKLAAAAVKAQEKIAKAEEKRVAAEAKAVERKAKAEAALEAARKKVADAAAAANKTAGADAPQA